MRIALPLLLSMGFFATAQAEEAAPAAPAAAPAAPEAAPAAAAKVTEADCKAALDNMFKIEFAKDPDSANQMAALMAAAKETDDYKEALAECIQNFTPEIAKCVINAKSDADIEACDK